jgi:tetratricopeptide (TPR) repeat protein
VQDRAVRSQQLVSAIDADGDRTLTIGEINMQRERNVWDFRRILTVLAVSGVGVTAPAAIAGVQPGEPTLDAEVDPGALALDTMDAVIAELTRLTDDGDPSAERIAEIDAAMRGLRSGTDAATAAKADAMRAQLDDDLERMVELAERAAELAPNDPQTQFVLGTAQIRRLSEGPKGLGSIGQAKSARNAWERAIELDPKYTDAYISLAMFHLNAPGIAGGSKKKAEELANDLIRIGEKAWGHRLLMQTSLARKRWDEAATRFRGLLRVAETSEDRYEAYRMYLYPLVMQHERAEDAIKFLPVYEEIAPEEDIRPDFLWGMSYMQRNDRGDRVRAIGRFESVLATSPDARNSRWYAAELLRKEKRRGEAAAHYEEFASRFPDDERAKDATKWARKLNR